MLEESSNIDITNNIFKNIDREGIELVSSSNNDIANNTFTNIYGNGIRLYKSSNNSIAGNTLTNFAEGTGISLRLSSNNSIADNTITNSSRKGIRLVESSYNDIASNTITENYYGIELENSIHNMIYHNKLINNDIQATDSTPANNNWYHPNLLEGNYWSDYPGMDDGSGTDKHAIAGDGIGDTDIPWPETDYDFYPLMNPRGGPDFVIYQKDISFTINTGEGITASNAKVTNIGTADFVGDVVVQFFEEDESTGNLIQIGNQTIVNLGYGKIKTVSVEWQPIRSRIVIVYVDPENKIAELDETNNWAEKGIGGYTPVVQDVYSKFGVWVGNYVGTFLTDLDIFGISIDNTFTANVGDRDGAEDVKKVVFELNDEKQYNASRRGDDPQSSRLWDCVLEMSDLQPGENTLKITATDAMGMSSETKTVIIRTLGLPIWIKGDIEQSLALKIPINKSGWEIEWDIKEQKISISKTIPSDEEPPLENTREPPETVPAAGGRDCSTNTTFGIKLSYYIKTGEAKVEGGGEIKFNALGYQATGRITVHIHLKPDLSFDNATVAFYLKVPVFALSGKVTIDCIIFKIKIGFGIAYGGVIGLEAVIKAVEEGLKLMSALIDLGIWGTGWLQAKVDLVVIGGEIYASIYAGIHLIVKGWLEGGALKVRGWLEGYIGFRWKVIGYINWLKLEASGKLTVSFRVGSPGEVNETRLEEPWISVQDYTTLMDSRPRVAADANGKATMIWVQNRVGPDNRTYADISYAMWDGTDWGTPGYITHDAQPDFDPALTYDSEGNVIAVWSRILGDLETHTPDDPFGILGTQEIVYAIWDRTTKTWSPHQQLTDDACADGRAVVSAGPDGTALAIWVGDIDHNLTTTDDMNLYYSIWDGTDWTPEAALTSNTVMDYSVSLAHDSEGNAIACWVRDRDGNLSTSFDTELRYARWDGTNWSPSRLVTELNETKQSPSITFDQNDNVLVTWVGGDEITNRLYFTSRDKTTGTWSKPEIVHDAAIFIYHPAINVDPDNTAVIVWRGFQDDEAERLYYYTHNATETYFDGEICYATKNLAQADVSWSEVKYLTSDNKTDWMASAVIIRGHSNDILLVWDKEGVVEDLVHPIKPDLTLDNSDITFSNDYPSAGETIDIMARIRNIGDVDKDNVRVDFYDGDPSNGGALIGTQFINYLPYDGEINVTLPWVVEPGTTYIYVVIDSLDSISEIDETNNIAYNTIIILPDLTVSPTNITYSPSDPFVDESITIFTTIHNLGGTNAENVLIHFYSNDNQIGSQTISLLNANDYATVSIEWTATTLYNNITVIIDPFNEIEEWDEENNIASTSISILSNLDLELTEMSLSTHLLLHGENVKITAEIQNLGSADVNGVLVKFFDGNPFINGISIYKETINVPLGGTYTSSSVWTPPQGTHLVFVVVDYENLIAESNEINNALYDELVVRGLADLSLLEADITAESGSIMINATVKNLGTAGATGVVVHLYDRDPAIGGILLDSQLISHIAAGGNGTAYLTLYEPPQTGSLYFVVDPENAINESDETNNKVETSLETIESRPSPSVLRWILPVAVLIGVFVGVLVILRRRRKPPSAD
ncbi:MAG: CARDB domain-containing protein [Candidatus Heimdallarchaeota archaeon]